jgi:hypothetical protein
MNDVQAFFAWRRSANGVLRFNRLVDAIQADECISNLGFISSDLQVKLSKSSPSLGRLMARGADHTHGGMQASAYALI